MPPCNGSNSSPYNKREATAAQNLESMSKWNADPAPVTADYPLHNVIKQDPVKDLGRFKQFNVWLLLHIIWISLPLAFIFKHALLDLFAEFADVVDIVKCLPINFIHTRNYSLFKLLFHNL